MLSHEDNLIRINKVELYLTDVAPQDCQGQMRHAINYIRLPLPLSHTNSGSKIKSLRLAVFLIVVNSMFEITHHTDHQIPSGLVFSFESSNGNSDLRSISTYDMQNYYSDIKYVLKNNYNFNNIIFTESNVTKDFVVNLGPRYKPYSIEEIRTILFVYNNPIELKDGYLQVLWNTENRSFKYTVDVGLVRLYFFIGLNYDETKCITQVYWDKNLSDNDFNYLELQTGLNGRIYTYMPWGMSPGWPDKSNIHLIDINTYTGAELPMAFRYYSRGDYNYLESECGAVNNSYIRRYLLAILSSKIVYQRVKDREDFISREMFEQEQED